VKASHGVVVLLCALILAGCGGTVMTSNTNPPLPAAAAPQPGVARVEVIYLNHLPIRSVLAEIDQLLGEYGDKVQVTRYDFNSPEGRAFAEAQGLHGHTPVVIFINGSMQATIESRMVTFSNFPGSNWTIQDLRAILDQATAPPA